jgi:hypothetical protein
MHREKIQIGNSDRLLVDVTKEAKGLSFKKVKTLAF